MNCAPKAMDSPVSYPHIMEETTRLCDKEIN